MKKNKDFVLLKTGRKIRIIFSDEENSAVKYAISNLTEDIRKVCNCVVERGSGEAHFFSEDETTIVIATMDTPWFSQVMSENINPAVEKIKDEQGLNRWEAYLHQTIGNMFCIVGADRRGTIFGIYELCEQIGVSPWHFWADVPVKRKEYFVFSQNYCKADWPDVPYRGVFLNDEEELDAWSKLHTKDNTIGPETYCHIYELILRLKGNYIWPAMHVNYFNGNPENGRLAQEMGIVVGTSHCDMLLRSNQNEWKPWLEQKGYQHIKYDYSIPGKNREIIQEYWAESVEMNRDYEACYTVGMRGIHDYGFITEIIDKDLSLTQEEKTVKKVKLLEQVISDQRKIMKDILGEDKGSCALQTFIPYKEVLNLYDLGLQVPDDVTMIWVDDNFGYMRRYPTAEEQQRKGGNGLYYHASYWAAPGMSYLFLNSIPLAHTGNELKKCWESGIRKMWVLNIGALKPLEVDMEFFLRYGWEAGKATGDTKDVSTFTANWIDRNFSGNFGQEAAKIYNQFTQLNNVCKLEHMQSDKFSQTVYGNEAKDRLDELRKLVDRAGGIYLGLPEEEREAFFELFLMKLQASYYINASFYYADRSRLSWNRGAMQAADKYLESSRRMDRKKQQMLYYYNHVMKNGKWEGILTPESFSPPPTVLYPAAKPALVIGDASLGVVRDEEFIFYAHGKKQKQLTLFNKGCKEVGFEVDVPEWLQVSENAGKVAAEKVLDFQVCENKREIAFEKNREGCIIIIGETGERYEINVLVKKKSVLPCEGKAFYLEADGYVSIPADGYVENISTNTFCWREIKYMGRGWGNAMEAFCTFDQDFCNATETLSMPEIKSNCRLEYPFFLESSGRFQLEIHRFLTLNPTGKVRLAIGVDDGQPILVETETVDEWRGKWREAVMNDGEKLYIQLPWLIPGLHTLKVYPVDRYVTLNKLVIYTEERRETNFGPADSAFFDGAKWHVSARQKDVTVEHIEEAETEFWQELYGNPQEKDLLLPMLYADPDFWKGERLYTPSDARENRLGKEKYGTGSDGKKNIFCKFGSGLFVECNGKIAIEAEYALENSENAYLTASATAEALTWSHTQAETDGRTGLAMMIEEKGILWEIAIAQDAPGMHYRIRVKNPGSYYIWLLMKFEDTDSDSCYMALDGTLQDISQFFSGRGNFFTYSMKQRWHWRAVTSMELEAGIHIFSIIGKKSGLQIDRIYMSTNSEWPPVDEDWIESERKRTTV